MSAQFGLTRPWKFDPRIECSFALGAAGRVGRDDGDFVAQLELAKRLNKAAQPNAVEQISHA